MVAQNIIFGIFALLMAAGAIRVVTTDNIVHSALWLVVVLAGGAAQFLILAQEFVAWVQVIVYIGAVIVLFLFGIMLTRAPMQATEKLNNDLRLPGAVVAVAMAGVLAWLCIDQWGSDKVEIARPIRTNEVGTAIFREYLIPFEVVGVLLLAALIGAVVLARRD